MKNGDHLRMNEIGTVGPRSGQFYVIGTSNSDSVMIQAFLSEAAEGVSFSRPITILVLDNASCHRKKSLNWH